MKSSSLATALSSSLASRSSPSIPPATQVYEPLVKSILIRRFVRNVLAVSAVAAWAVAALWSSWQHGGIRSLGIFGGITTWLSPLTLLCAVLWWSLASMPIAVLRKLFLQASYSPSATPYQALLQQIRERRYQHVLAVTFLSSISLAAFHAFSAQMIERYYRGDPKLGVWAGSRKHPYHLNGRLCFLFLSQTTCALVYWLRDALQYRFSIRWPRQSNFISGFSSLLIYSLLCTLALSTGCTVLSLAIFVFLRSILLPIVYRLPIIHGLLRPSVAHFLRPVYTITLLWSNLGLVIRSFVLALSTCFLREVPSTIFDAAFSFPAEATANAKDSGLILVSGINSSETYLQFHAFHELSLLASDATPMNSERAIIYNDTKYNPTPWASLVRRSLLLLGADYQLFLRRGDPAPPPTPVSEPPVARQVTSTEKLTTSVIRTQVYKMPQATPMDRIADTLASDSPITGLLAQSGAAVEIPKVFGRALRPWIQSIRVDVRPPNFSNYLTRFSSSASHSVSVYAPFAFDFVRWWTRERKDRLAMKALPNKELDVMIVEALSKLVAHSLTEDRMGFVQRDIPRVLEAMALFLAALEDYQKELAAFVSSKEADGERDQLHRWKEESACAREWMEGLTEALRTGLSHIIKTFGIRLSNYKFPPKIAARLQVFADYTS